jgi:hypothetical protein
MFQNLLSLFAAYQLVIHWRRCSIFKPYEQIVCRIVLCLCCFVKSQLYNNYLTQDIANEIQRGLKECDRALQRRNNALYWSDLSQTLRFIIAAQNSETLVIFFSPLSYIRIFWPSLIIKDSISCLVWGFRGNISNNSCLLLLDSRIERTAQNRRNSAPSTTHLRIRGTFAWKLQQ